jgi:hypothetical protein
MRSEKYVYNPHTLQFEKVKLGSKGWLLRIFGFASAVIVTTALFFFITSEYFPSPREKSLKKELTQLEYQLLVIKDQMQNMNKVVDNIQQRDAHVHRVLFGMDPIDKDVWEGGIGGHDPLSWTDQLKTSGSTLKDAKRVMTKLERHILNR